MFTHPIREPSTGTKCYQDFLSGTCGNGLLEPGEECDDGGGEPDVVPVVRLEAWQTALLRPISLVQMVKSKPR